MKKYLLFIFLSFAMLISNAQNIIIRDADGNVVNGTTITYNIHPSVDAEEHQFEVSNESNMNISVNGHRFENNCTAGSGEHFCWSLCLSTTICGSNFMSQMPTPQMVNANSISPVPLITDFEPSYLSDEDGLEGTASYTYVLYDDDNPSDSAYVILVYNIDYTVGISEINENAISSIYPNPAQSSIQFNLDNNIALAQFEIYSMVGKKVKQINVENAQGKISININELAPGVYFLSEKNSSVTRKFIVSR
jgi:hypothetical protein